MNLDTDIIDSEVFVGNRSNTSFKAQPEAAELPSSLNSDNEKSPEETNMEDTRAENFTKTDSRW